MRRGWGAEGGETGARGANRAGVILEVFRLHDGTAGRRKRRIGEVEGEEKKEMTKKNKKEVKTKKNE